LQQYGPHTMILSFTGNGSINNNRADGYYYDFAGNTTWDGYNSYTYDAENRMLTAAYNVSSAYVYDANGRRVRKTVSGVSVDFLYDLAGREIAEVSSTGVWNRSEIYAGARHLATYNNGTTYFNHADWLGTERVRSNVSGVPTETCTSLVFGDWLTCSNSDSSPMHLTGKEHDFESGLDNFGARYNSSRWGRFMSPDWSSAPMGVPYANFSDPQTLNLYAYVKNNPLTYVDRDGHCGDPLTFVVCAAIGAAAAGLTVYELHKWHKEREKAENDAFQKSYNCAMGSGGCTEGETRAYDKERLNTYGEGAIKAIENTVPDATPSTSITDVVIDQVKGKAVDAMVDSAKKTDDKQPNKEPQPSQPKQPNQQPSITPNAPPPPKPPPPPACAFDKEQKC